MRTRSLFTGRMRTRRMLARRALTGCVFPRCVLTRRPTRFARCFLARGRFLANRRRLAARFLARRRAAACEAVRAGRRHLLDLPGGLLLDREPAPVVLLRDERDRGALAARAAGAADAVRVAGDVARHVVVDHVRHVAHVETARGDVGRDERLDLARAEGAHDAEARGLVVAAVQRLDREGQALEAPVEPVDVLAPAAEDEQHVLLGAALDHADQRQRLVVLADRDPVLLDIVDGLEAARGGDLGRRARVLARELEQRRREGGREEQRLALLGDEREDHLDVVEEADLEHLVGFVEHRELRPGEGEEALLVEVEHAAGRAHDDLRAALQRADLAVHRFAADDQRDLDSARLAELAQHVADLLREFARGRQHEAQHAGARGVDLRHHRRAEGERLAGAGLGLGDHVLAFEHGADRQALDRRGLGDAHGLDHGLHVRLELPVAEALDLGRGRGRVQRFDVGCGRVRARAVGGSAAAGAVGTLHAQGVRSFFRGFRGISGYPTGRGAPRRKRGRACAEGLACWLTRSCRGFR